MIENESNVKNKVTEMKKCFKDELKSLKKELGTERSRKIKTKRKLEKLENQLEELKSVTKMSVSCQTNHSSDIPYSVSEELPPIFGSHLSQNSKSIHFLSRSHSDLSIFSWVKISEEDIFRDEAEQALNEQYNREVL